MSETLPPGVSIEEADGLPPRITGVSTSLAAMLGPARRGPLTPVVVDDVAAYARVFGGRVVGGWLAQAVEACVHNGGRRVVVCRVVGSGAVTASAHVGAFTVRASGPGTCGNDIATRLEHAAGGRVDMRVGYWGGGLPEGDPFAVGQPAPTVMELLEDLARDARREPRTPTPALIELVVEDGSSAPLPDPGVVRLAGGLDGAPPGLDDYLGVPAPGRDTPQGLAALDHHTWEDVALVHAPGASPELAAALVAHCAGRRDRFAIIDGTPAILAAPRQALGDSAWGACYWPWLLVGDAATGATIAMPPGGAVAGIYARVDEQRGVFKAPANEPVAGIIAPAEVIDDVGQGALAQAGVNPIRRFTGRGTRVWGARTLASDREWRYVSVRRYATYLEQSIARGTRWTVFEPSTPALWGRVVSAVQAFLLSEWRGGGLQGRSPNEAFFVKCDASTMTADDIASGRLVCEIGVAIVRPAEFILVRVAQQGVPA